MPIDAIRVEFLAHNFPIRSHGTPPIAAASPERGIDEQLIV